MCSATIMPSRSRPTPTPARCRARASSAPPIRTAAPAPRPIRPTTKCWSRPTATRCSPTAPTRPRRQSQVVVRNDPTRWHLWWTAPQAGSGPVTLYVAAVDGNGGSGSADNDQDPYGDDTVDAQFFIPEAGNPAPPGVSAGCALSGRAAAPSGALVLFGLALALFALRRRRASTAGRRAGRARARR